jgi:SNF2 family DNA or RNA helicase
MTSNGRRACHHQQARKIQRLHSCRQRSLGKTFTALAVIKYYELRNRMVLVLCPKKLGDNWHTFKENYLNNPIAAYVCGMTCSLPFRSFQRPRFVGDIDLAKLNWGNYDLVVIDESHNFRNGGIIPGAVTTNAKTAISSFLTKLFARA